LPPPPPNPPPPPSALLLKEALEDICKDKRQRYEAWRKAALSGPRLGAKLRSFALWTLLPVAATLYMAQVCV
jgi:hypothetical protein